MHHEPHPAPVRYICDLSMHIAKKSDMFVKIGDIGGTEVTAFCEYNRGGEANALALTGDKASLLGRSNSRFLKPFLSLLRRFRLFSEL